jgi:hypothetical protein
MIYLALAIVLFFAVPVGLECLFAYLMDDAEKNRHLQESIKITEDKSLGQIKVDSNPRLMPKGAPPALKKERK